MFFFQHPLADTAVLMNDLEFIDRLWADWSPGYDASRGPRSREGLAARPGRTGRGARARTARPSAGHGQVPEFQAYEDAVGQTPPQPHLYLHGLDDGCIGSELAGNAQDFMPVAGSRAVIVEGTGTSSRSKPRTW